MDENMDRDLCNPSPPPHYDETKPDITVVIKKEEPDSGSEEEGQYEDFKQEPLEIDDAWGACENQYYCKYCKSSMNSEYTFYTHLKGKRHKKRKAAAAYVTTSNVKIEPMANINVQRIKIAGAPMSVKTRQLNEKPLIQNTVDQFPKPLVGLGFVSEIQMADDTQDPVYRCVLCPAECQVTTILNHVIGFKHRMAYMKLVDPEQHRKMSLSSDKKSNLSDRLEHYTIRLEKQDGRGQMIVEVQIDDDMVYEAMDACETGNIFPQLPTSTLPQLLQQEQKLPTAKRLQLLQELASCMSTCPNASQKQNGVTESMKGKLQAYYMRSKMDQLDNDPEMFKRMSDDLCAGKYSKVLQDVFHMTIGPYGQVTKPVYMQLIKSKEFIPD